jgi:hypothetical protein
MEEHPMATEKKSTTKTLETVEILEVKEEHLECYILGRSPLIMNAMSEKTKQGLLCPGVKKTAVTKATTLKHQPFEEYRGSMYVLPDGAPTRCAMPATAFKAAMRSVALDIPGAQKSQIGRLTYVVGDRIPIFGVPQLLFSNVRTADMAHTPDVRARAIFPEWACTITVTFVVPLLRQKDIANLLAAAGLMRGVGDWRPEKGSGSYGQFELVAKTDPRWVNLVKTGGVKAQDAAIAHPTMYDEETRKLMTWFCAEVERRGFKVAA